MAEASNGKRDVPPTLLQGHGARPPAHLHRSVVSLISELRSLAF